MRISDWSSDVCSSDLLDERGREIEHWNTGRDAPNRRQMTNIGVFRAYVAAYLAAHPGINHEMTQMVRQLAPGPAGLPLELYCFTASTARSEERRVGKGCFGTCRSRGAPDH